MGPMSLPESSLFRLALEWSRIGIVVCDESGTVLFANPQAQAIFGYDAGAIHSRHLVDLLPSTDSTSYRGVRQVNASRGDGTEVPVEVGFVVSERDEGGLIV